MTFGQDGAIEIAAERHDITARMGIFNMTLHHIDLTETLSPADFWIGQLHASPVPLSPISVQDRR